MKVWTYQTDCNNATTANIAFGYAGAGEIINTGIEEKAILKKMAAILEIKYSSKNQ